MSDQPSKEALEEEVVTTQITLNPADRWRIAQQIDLKYNRGLCVLFFFVPTLPSTSRSSVCCAASLMTRARARTVLAARQRRKRVRAPCEAHEEGEDDLP